MNRKGKTPRKFEFNGQLRTIKEWSAFTGLKSITIFKRLQYGWSFEKTITTPARKYVKNRGGVSNGDA